MTSTCYVTQHITISSLELVFVLFVYTFQSSLYTFSGVSISIQHIVTNWWHYFSLFVAEFNICKKHSSPRILCNEVNEHGTLNYIKQQTLLQYTEWLIGLIALISWFFYTQPDTGQCVARCACLPPSIIGVVTSYTMWQQRHMCVNN